MKIFTYIRYWIEDMLLLDTPESDAAVSFIVDRVGVIEWSESVEEVEVKCQILREALQKIETMPFSLLKLHIVGRIKFDLGYARKEALRKIAKQRAKKAAMPELQRQIRDAEK